MRAALLHEYGAAPVPGSRPEPVGSAGEVIVTVTAAPVAPLDLLCATGASYFGRQPLPYVPGVQGVGVVRDLGSSGAAAGGRVWFATSAGMRPGDGSLAPLCAVPAQDVVPVPDGVDDTLAAAVGTSGIAAWMCLTWRGRLQPGERVLVLGAGGAVGQCAVAAASALGAGRVVGACRSPTSAARAKRAGADDVVVLQPDEVGSGSAADPAAVAARFVEAAGGLIDVVVDPVFGPAAAAAVVALGPRGRLVNLGGLSGDRAELSSAVLRAKSVDVLGYTNNAITPAQRADALSQVLSLAAAGRLTVEHAVLPLDQVGLAWQRATAGDGVRQVVALR